ncbi:Asp-tRNA(Asn)/Glu-tRNA(Gln) amidotransferase subunit GatA [Synoicihabitans lomoniglobus]|uniref:Glutamyl-tRNA(Gln) amidotransferase subunit A n=1 Tax=Synoicihabitans lomoniglobus TaxID=2909285 RepID=A0AAF0CQ76_9BACT|nr:Asp-tRNA(Asn)/Glu-tRNA(Gln) amidotransferase subunit GatA [Opitutaceae bacterium LMO-M01]WED66053.1 Asp-tRNA(Asn)/Glu-tRNA(Gln) amidotransferase subunit GatA [Opitutaceae bacterium LMO-M01]
MSTELTFQTIAQLADALAAGTVSSVELTQAAIDRATAVDDRVKAFNSVNPEDALAQAAASDARRSVGQARGPLDGIPVSLKDVIAVRDQPLTASSKMLENFVSPYDATVTEKLKAAGAVLWGRANLDEFAMGSSTENSAFQTTCNPYDLDRVPGGSSGGSAAAVAAGEAVATLGSDTGGSIRQPAAFCNVVGLKPTYGLVSRYGLAAFASSLDQIGPFTRTVEDAAIMLGAIAGHDPRDSTSFKTDVPDYRAALSEKKGPWKLGIPKEYFGEGLDPEVGAAIEKAIAFYREQGCEIKEVSLPHTPYCLSTYYIIATAEASSNLARYDGIRYTHRSADAQDVVDLYFKSRAEGFGPEVKRRIILGTYVLSSGYYDAYYLRAQKVRTLIRQDFLNAYEQVDAILTPTTPTPAFKAGEKAADPLAMYLSDIYTIGVNLAGLPGISIPAGFTSAGLPIGLQLIGQPYAEADLLAIAHAYDTAHDWHSQRPEL